MRPVSFLFLMALFCWAKLFAQSSLPPIFEIKNDTTAYVELDNVYWQILEDRPGKLSINDVTKTPGDGQFHTDSSRVKGVDNSLHTYWFRMRLKNSMLKEISISFGNEPYSEQFDLYIFRKDSSPVRLTSGVFIPYSKRDGFKGLQAIPVVLQPGEEITIYKHIYRASQPYRATDQMLIGFMFTEKLMLGVYNDSDINMLYTILRSFSFGVLILACLFNFFFYYINRERVYLFFASFLFFEGLVVFELLFLFFLRDYPKARAYLYPLEKFAAYFFLVHFVRYLLHTNTHFPKWDKLLRVLSILPCISSLAALFIEPFLSGKWSGSLWIVTTQFTAIGLFALLATFIFFRKENNRTIGIMLIAVLPVMCLWALNYGFVYVYEIFFNWYAGLQSSGISQWMSKWQSIGGAVETICLFWLVVFFSWILFLRYSQLREENEQQALDKERLAKEREMEKSQLIEQQKVELEKTVEERTTELKQSLEELKATQKQLIQSEKMASLGELTAGIAHEIQNPLNFVNNFSDVNKELIEELRGEKQKAEGERNTAIEDEILGDIEQNLEKINYHGKRADAIVKGMLQHSRTSTGQKEPTDINALCDEYLRLSYHGMRAKDKSFSAEIKTDFDNGIGKINVVPQDIGRVLLNLYNNAFYAVNERCKAEGVRPKAESSTMQVERSSYVPTVTVVTKKISDKIAVKVIDNGNGIPQNIVDKIFQPFFTTKPTGQGTGLGLSLTYDIIKAHGGEIKVNTKDGEGSEFVIVLPV